jgi:hypothetical protein
VSTPAHRRDPHLGGLVAAVVDGMLDHRARERALGHLARCDECRAEVDAQRRLKARLGRLGTPELPGGFAERLLGIPDAMAASRTGGSNATLVPEPPPFQLAGSFRTPAPRPAPSRGGAAGDRPRPAAGERPAGDGPASRPGRRRGRAARRRRVAGAAAGGFAAFALSLATVVTLGASDTPGAVAPAVDAYTVEHNRSAVSVPGADPLVEMVDLSTSLPR